MRAKLQSKTPKRAMSRWRREALLLLAAILLAIGTLSIAQTDIEIAQYQTESVSSTNIQPRLVAGWPAPFLADDPATSVHFVLGPEDEFRFWPFVADLAFWFCVAASCNRLVVTIQLIIRAVLR